MSCIDSSDDPFYRRIVFKICAITKNIIATFTRIISPKAENESHSQVSNNVTSIATPHHVPFHGADPNDFVIQRKKQEKRLSGSVQMSTINISDFSNNNLEKSKAPSVVPVLKPRDLWKGDQSLMLQGRYHFDANFSQKYILKQLLGEGSFGFVWVAERLNDHKEVAVKFILREKVPGGNWIFNSELGLVPLEVHIMKQVSHRNIIQFLDYFSDYRFAYLVTEYHGTSWTWPNPKLDPSRNIGLRPPGQLLQLSYSASTSKDSLGITGLTRRPPCDLFECIEAHIRLPEDRIRKIFLQVLDAVYYLFSLGITHRDIKDENIVIDEDYNIKIIDFGSAAFVPSIKSTTSNHVASVTNIKERLECEGYLDRFNGTLAFAAPEIIRGTRYKASEAEVWSLGVLLYALYYKKSPFATTDAILYHPLEIASTPSTGSDSVQDLITKMLVKNPINRIRLDQVQMHTFLELK